MIESLYALLTINHLSSKTKEIVLKIIKYLIASKRVPQQIRTQLRLETNQIGFGGIISGLAPNELNVSIVREILNLIINSGKLTTRLIILEKVFLIIESSIAVDHLNVVLTLCSAASLDVRYVAMRKVRLNFSNYFSLFLFLCYLANDLFYCESNSLPFLC